MTKAKSVEIQIKHLSATYGLAPGLVRRIQIAAIQSVALYGAEIWWKRQKNHEHKVQQLINHQARAIAGMYPSTPIQALISESGLVPARILLDHRQRMYTYRLLCLPDDHPTKTLLPISVRNGDGDTTREDEQPRDTSAWTKNEKPTSLGQWLAWQTSMANVVDPAYGVEPIKRSWRLNTNTCIQVIVQAKKEALQETTKTQAGITFWTEGLKLDTGDAGIWGKIRIRLMQSCGQFQMPWSLALKNEK